MDLKPLYCDGREDLWIQEREQWHSGANFFAVTPGKVVGYGRNVHTVEEMNKNGFEVIRADDIIKKGENSGKDRRLHYHPWRFRTAQRWRWGPMYDHAGVSKGSFVVNFLGIIQ